MKGLTVCGIFAGIGGFELGFRNAGFKSVLMCEIDEDARSVLSHHFPDTELVADINEVSTLPHSFVLLAGFPCQDLSAVGPRRGFDGTKSVLVKRLFDLLEKVNDRPEWIVLENVPFMLQLGGGRAIASIIEHLEELNYSWAYRIVDSRAFGLPQRRRRVFLVATNGSIEPSAVLFADDVEPPSEVSDPSLACGFYWTEGNTGLGWAVDAIPTLKGGSSISIPSPPAIWLRGLNRIILPDIRDAERFQGFEAGWTEITEKLDVKHRRRRWRQVGNAVSVPVAEWLARRLAKPGRFDQSLSTPIATGWPRACHGRKGRRWSAPVGEWPIRRAAPHLANFLDYDGEPISKRAATGFLFRARRSSLRLTPGFLEAVAEAAGLDRSEAARLK